MTTRLRALFERTFSKKVEELLVVKAHASARRIYRLRAAGRSVIGVLSDNKEENRAFIGIGNYLRAQGLPVPEIYAVSQAEDAYLQEDLGDETLFDRVERSPQVIEEIYGKVVDILPRFQVEVVNNFPFTLCYPSVQYDKKNILWDLRYFRESFLRRVECSFNEDLLERDFESFATVLESAPAEYFMHRDFQARNIMIVNESPYVIDFQSGRRGPLFYDISTLLMHPKVPMSKQVRERLLHRYRGALNKYVQIPDAEFDKYFFGFTLLQLFHRFGAYGRFGIGGGMKYFADSIPPAVAILKEVLCAEGSGALGGELRKVCMSIVEKPECGKAKKNLLEVKIGSFAYKNGTPVLGTPEVSWNGFVFDCRSLPNPGRHTEFVSKTGKDPETIAFLENESSVAEFYTHVKALVVSAVKNYLERGFSELPIAFGCTGGQHRSVYFAERLKRELMIEFPVKVSVRHREIKD